MDRWWKIWAVGEAVVHGSAALRAFSSERKTKTSLTERPVYSEVFLRNAPSPPSQSLTVLTEQLWLFKLQDSKVHLTAYSNNVLPPCTRGLHRRALLQCYRAQDVLLLYRVYFHVVIGRSASDWQACWIVWRWLMHISCLASSPSELLKVYLVKFAVRAPAGLFYLSYAMCCNRL